MKAKDHFSIKAGLVGVSVGIEIKALLEEIVYSSCMSPLIGQGLVFSIGQDLSGAGT